MRALIAATVFASLAMASNSFATDDLTQSPVAQEPADEHITWHEFRHELGAYPSVNVSINENGIITLTGHTDSVYEKAQLDRLARRVKGASDINNRISTD